MNCGLLPMTVRTLIARAAAVGSSHGRKLRTDPFGDRCGDARAYLPASLQPDLIDLLNRLDLARRRGEESLFGGEELIERAATLLRTVHLDHERARDRREDVFGQRRCEKRSFLDPEDRARRRFQDVAVRSYEERLVEP